LLDQGALALFGVEHLEDNIGPLRLLPEDVVRVAHLLEQSGHAAGLVPVEDRPAEGNVRLSIAIGPQGHVPAGQHKLELLAAGLAEDGNALVRAPLLAAGIILELPEEAGVPFGVDDPLPDVVDDDLLLPGVELAAAAADRMGRDLP